MLSLHPLIYLAQPRTPEPKFFLVDSEFHQGLAYYSERWFSAGAEHKERGEKSTNYLESTVAAKRIAAALPDVRLVFLLRNPVDRAFSNYRWSKQNGFENESFETALELEDARERMLSADLRYSRPHAYFSRGLYAQQLTVYFGLFPRESILCLRFEEILRDPENLLLQVYKFLNLPEGNCGLGRMRKVNASEQSDYELRPHTRRRLEEAYATPNAELKRLLGHDWEGWN